MRYGQVETEKLYFSSNEVAELLGVSVETLRSWEKQNPELNPEKNRAGKRTYRPSDIEIARRIKKSGQSLDQGKSEQSQGQGCLFEELPAEVKEVKKAKKPVKKRESGEEKAKKPKDDSLLKIRDSLKSALKRIKS